MLDFFPLRIITGPYFCNRIAERKALRKNIEKKRHTILASPRRYGKTSLSNQVFEELGKEWVTGDVDFLIATDASDIEKLILTIVGRVLPKIIPLHKNIFEKIRAFFSFAQARITISESGPTVEFIQTEKVQQTIQDALMGLDRLAEKEGKQVALLFDEFQQVGQLKNSETLEAAIRHAAERSKNVCYIFSGSNRHLLNQMFDDSSRPLYHVCEKISLERIEPEEYRAHLLKFSEARWKKSLHSCVIDEILSCTKCHPYYVNVLCSRIWDLDDPIETSEAANMIWKKYVEEEKGRIGDEITQLTLNQRKLLFGIALGTISQPTNKEFLTKINLSLASASQTLRILLEKDLIYRDLSSILRVVDPSLAYFRQHFQQTRH